MRALILLAAIAGLYLAFRWFLTQPRKTQLQATAVAVGLALIGLAATGRVNWVFAIFGALLPFVRRLLPLLSYLLSAGVQTLQERTIHSRTVCWPAVKS